MKWGLFDKTYTVVAVSTVPHVNFSLSAYGVSFIACVYECVAACGSV